MSMMKISHKNNIYNSFTNNSRCNTMATRMKLISQWITKRVKMRRWMRKPIDCRLKRLFSIIILNASNKRPT